MPVVIEQTLEQKSTQYRRKWRCRTIHTLKWKHSGEQHVHACWTHHKANQIRCLQQKKQKTRGSFLLLGEGKKTGYISRDTINKVKFQPKQGCTQTLTLLSWTKSSRTLENENIEQKYDGLRLLTEAQMDNMKLLGHHVFCIIFSHLHYGTCLDVQTNAIAMETFWSKHY